MGFATPVAQIRHARYMAENLKIIGDMSLATVSAHDENKAGAIQDEIVNAFDIGVSL
ncbi:YjgN family protein [Escherichia coli]|uniref:YjgN family protein n=1 Tax=Escherichia coli TaxID=562 RepID=UPI0021D2676E|nr:YjgN family protein [Escherichia coli]